MESFKGKTLEEYLEDVQSKLPGIPDYHLKWFEDGFKTGYNIRKVEEDERLQQNISQSVK